jgi:hypothetical protein
MFPRIGGVAFAFAAAIAVSACNDNAPTAIDRAGSPAFSQLDGATEGNPHFYFLRPIAPSQPSATGEFHGDLYPTVEICSGTAQTETNHCATLLASFTLDGGVNNGGDVITIPAGEEMYKVEWHTAAYDVPIDEPLRVSVLLGDFQAGYIDVVKSETGGFKNSENNAAISGNGTLPIKFRLEHGVICGDNPNCVESTVGTEGGTFTVGDETNVYAGAEFPPGALNGPVNLVIEEVTEGECLPTDVQQFSLCYHYTTEPRVANFNVPVTVAFCMTDPAALQYQSDGQLRLWKWSETNGDPLVELEKVIVDFLDCPDLSGIGYRNASPWLRGLARAGHALVAPVALLIGPRELHAIGGEGGKLINFSRIGWVRPLDIEITQGNAQTAQVGTSVAVPPTVRVKNRYGIGPQAVAGRRVEFTASPDGNATPANADTNGDGLASTNWTLATTPGANTLLAHVPTSRTQAPAPYETEITFNATGVDNLFVQWLPPLVKKGVAAGTFVSGLAARIEVSEVGGALLATLPMAEGAGLYAASWNVPVLLPDRTYRIALIVGGSERGNVSLQVINGELRNVSTGDNVLNLKNSRTLPIKVVLSR